LSRKWLRTAALATGLAALAAGSALLLHSALEGPGRFVHSRDIAIPKMSVSLSITFISAESQILLNPDGPPCIYDLQSGRELRVFEGGGYLTVTPDGRLAALDETSGTFKKPGEVHVKVFKLDTAEKVRMLSGPSRRGTPTLAWSPDGRWLARGNRENSIDLWDLRSDGGLRNLLPDTMMDNSIEALVFSRDGRLMISGESRGGVRVRAATAWEVVQNFRFPMYETDEQMVMSIALSADGSLLAAGGGFAWSSSETTRSHGIVKIWRLSDWSEVSTFETPELVMGIAFSPDGTYLASSVWKEARIWDLRTGRNVATLPVSANGWPGIAFSPEGLLATTNSKGVLSLWKKSP